MMIRLLSFIILVIFFINLQAQERYPTPFELDSNHTATYDEMIAFYTELAENSPLVHIKEVGETDIGKPLHLVIVSNALSPDPLSERESGKAIVLINNAIHPGEPCGVDASMMLARDFVTGKIYRGELEHYTLLIVPAYNLGGMLNRNSYSRANQDGPESYGFRGNAQNLDLNRDFMKSDSKNARSLQSVFAKWRPHVFVDTHTTNGADYPYVMTLIATQKNQLGGPLAELMREEMLPALYTAMEEGPYPMCPYVFYRDSIEAGLMDFNDSPRYSTGFAALQHSMGFVTEAHMLKPFRDRVMSTWWFLKHLLEYTGDHSASIVEAQRAQMNHYLNENEMALKWALDTTQVDSFLFRGYTRKVKQSRWSGGTRHYYDQEDAYEKNIFHFTDYAAVEKVEIPEYYILPQAYDDLIKKLDDNGVYYEKLMRDTVIEGDFYRIESVETSQTAYEGHFWHPEVEVSTIQTQRQFFKGDIRIPTRQWSIRYIVNALEPHAADSWLLWNFFDGILMQKEHFSSYVFEDRAYELLQQNPELKSQLEEAKQKDAEFAKSPYKQMKFIYERSPHYEKTHRIYPVGRLF